MAKVKVLRSAGLSSSESLLFESFKRFTGTTAKTFILNRRNATMLQVFSAAFPEVSVWCV